MHTYFNIRYEFDKESVHQRIADKLDGNGTGYICVADGVILDTVNRNTVYRQVVNEGMFSICDSSYVPLYIRWIYGKRYEQYCGSQIFMDIVKSRKYRMIFMGTRQAVLDALKKNLVSVNPDVVEMQFVELPFRAVEDFDYEGIAREIEADGLGCPEAGILYEPAETPPEKRGDDCRRGCLQILQWCGCQAGTCMDGKASSGVRLSDIQ